MLVARLLAFLFLAGAPVASPQDAAELERNRLAGMEAYRRGEYAGAAELLRASLGEDNVDWERVYNLACCLSLAGEPGPALDALEQAIDVCLSRSQGLSEKLARLMELLESDPDLVPIREASTTASPFAVLADRLEHFAYSDTPSALERARRRLQGGHPDLALGWVETAVEACWGAPWLERLLRSDTELQPVWREHAREIRQRASDLRARLASSSEAPGSWIDWVDGHRDVLMSVDVDPSGTRFVTTGRDRTARIWDLADMQPRVTLRGHENFVLSARFSHDGEKVVTACVDRTARVWDARSGALIRAFSAGSILQSAEFSPDDRLVVTAGMEDRLAHVWDVEQGELVRTLEGARKGVWSVAISPDAELIATGSLDTDVRVYESATGKLLWTWDDPQGTVRRVEFSPDGEHVLVTSYDGVLRLYETEAEAEPVVFSRPGNDWLAAAFDPTGEAFVAAGDAGQCFVWSVQGREVVHTLNAERNWLMDVTFTPDGDRILAAGWDRGVHVWNALTEEPLAGIEYRPAGIAGAAFSPQGDRLVTLGPAGPLEWSLEEGVVVAPRGQAWRVQGEQDQARTLSWRSPESYDWSGSAVSGAGLPVAADAVEAYIAPGGAAVYSIRGDGAGSLWIAADGGKSVTLTDKHVPVNPEEPWQREIHKAAFSADGRLLVTVFHGDSRARIWDAHSGQRLQLIRGHGDEVIGAAFSPDGARLVTASRDATAGVWDVSTASSLLRLGPIAREVSCAAFSPDGRWIATGDFDATVKLWDAETGALQATLEGHQRPVLGVTFSPDGLRLASTSLDETTRLWDGLTYELLASLVDFGGGDWLSFTPQLYYAGSSGAAQRASLSLGAEPFPLTCFASMLERPDAVRKSLDGFPETPANPPRPPELVLLAPTEREYASPDRGVRLRVRAEDTLGIERIELAQDGVPEEQQKLRGAVRIEELDGKRGELDWPVAIPTGIDATTITVRAVNSRGILSREQRIRLRYEAPTQNLYLLAIGVWRYDDSSLDLQSPGKDVASVVAFFEGQKGRLYDDVIVKRMENKDVSTGALRRVRDQFLRSAGPDDTIVVFVAGHAVISEASEYYFLTPSATPSDPYPGVDRNVLEDLVVSEKLHARRRVMFIDTCHAGASGQGLRGRGIEDFINSDHATALTDRSKGLYILAASSDRESAREEEDNGLFTRALLDGLAGGADREVRGNQSGYVEVEELLGYVQEVVRLRTNGAQVPVLPRVESGENFRIAKLPD